MRMPRSGAGFIGVVACGALLVVGSVRAEARTCSAGKRKCARALVAGILACHRVAEAKGIAVDAACLQEARDGFDGGSDPSQGCVAKVEAKQDPAKPETICPVPGDAAAAEARLEAFALDLVDDLDPAYPVVAGKNKCTAGKVACAGAKVKELFSCHRKTEVKGMLARWACLWRSQRRFDAAPRAGCFAKFEARQTPAKPETVCRTTGDATATGLKIDAFMDEFVCDTDPDDPICVSPHPSTCVAGKQACASGRLVGALACHVSAARKGTPLASTCLPRVQASFDGSATERGCFARREATKINLNRLPLGRCPVIGDSAAIAGKLDAFVLDLVDDLSPGYPAFLRRNTCVSGKIKCASAKIKALLRCHRQAWIQGVPVSESCLEKARLAFARRPQGGCFASLEARAKPLEPESVCPTVGDAAAVGAKIDAFVRELACALDPGWRLCPPAG